MEIYVDEIFVVNMLSELLLLAARSALSGVGARRLRLLAASAAGGLYAAVEAAAGLPRVLRLPMLFAVCLAAFGRRRLARGCAELMLLAACAEGLTVAAAAFFGADAQLARGTVTLFAPEAPAAVLYALPYPLLIVSKRLRDRRGRRLRISVSGGVNPAEFTALRDSGNLLKHRGLPVIFIDRETGLKVSGCEDYEELKAGAEEFVTYRTVDGLGVLPLLTPEHCEADGREVRAVLAAADRSFSEKYSGIAGEL